jgi:hypothetical protein
VIPKLMELFYLMLLVTKLNGFDAVFLACSFQAPDTHHPLTATRHRRPHLHPDHPFLTVCKIAVF